MNSNQPENYFFSLAAEQNLLENFFFSELFFAANRLRLISSELKIISDGKRFFTP